MTNASLIEDAPTTPGGKVLELFDTGAMNFESKRAKSHQPSLQEMTAKSIALLETDPDGFFLMVEGGRIDHAAGARDYRNATGETLAFDDAVQTALDFAGQRTDTLVIVTADHETGGLILQGGGDAPGIFATGSELSPNGTGLVFDEAASHTAVDVPIMTSGPGADGISHGTIDNTQVFGIMRTVMGL